MLTKDLAICIRAVDYSETSQIVTFFARAAGKISTIAKGSKRPKSAFDGPIEILSHGKIVFSDSNREGLATLTEFESARGGAGLAHLRDDLFALNCCFFAVELVNRLTHDYDPHPKLFDHLLQFLESTADTNRQSRETISLLILFQFALLREIGLQPVLDHCVNCKTRYEVRDKRDEVYFSSSANGLICRDCEVSFPDKIRLTKDAGACLADLKQVGEAPEETLSEIERILVHHFTELIGKPPKMAKYVLSV